MLPVNSNVRRSAGKTVFLLVDSCCRLCYTTSYLISFLCLSVIWFRVRVSPADSLLKIKNTGGNGIRNKNAVSKSYLSDNQRFAQICNNQLFGGRKLIWPEKLRELDPGELAIKGGQASDMEVLEKYRDVLRVYDNQMMFLILGIENQNEVHYAMPLSQMLYDVLKYEEQRVQVEREHREKKDLRGSEYISGMAKSDRLLPVITLTVYWGKEAWDGAKSLYEMLDIPPVLSQYKDIINDYRMNLLEVHSMENLEAYSGELKALLGFVRYQKEKGELSRFVDDNKDIFRELTPETIRAISVLSNAQELDIYFMTGNSSGITCHTKNAPLWMCTPR